MLRLRLLLAAAVLMLLGGGAIYLNRDDASPTDQVATVADGAPSYCKQLSTTPKGFSAALSSAAAGNASAQDKKLIGDVVRQLRTAATAKGVSPELKGKINSATALLDKLAKGDGLTLADARNLAKSLQTMGEAVKKACSGK